MLILCEPGLIARRRGIGEPYVCGYLLSEGLLNQFDANPVTKYASSNEILLTHFMIVFGGIG